LCRASYGSRQSVGGHNRRGHSNSGEVLELLHSSISFRTLKSLCEQSVTSQRKWLLRSKRHVRKPYCSMVTPASTVKFDDKSPIFEVFADSLDIVHRKRGSDGVFQSPSCGGRIGGYD